MKGGVRILKNKLHLAVKLSLSVKLLLIIFIYSVFADLEFNFNPKKRIEAGIAVNELNRIGVIGGEVIEVIGDENKYSLYWSGDFRNLFIKPKVEVGEIIELSLILPQGGAQDIRFTVGDCLARTIFINLGSKGDFRLTEKSIKPLANKELKSEIARMMRAMINGEGCSCRYYVQELKRTIKKSKTVQIRQEASYRYRNLSGAVLSIKNLTSKPLNLDEADFSNIFKNTVAINLGDAHGQAMRVIKPRGAARVFIITKEGEHD
ncbi:MAG: type-F conjugative transfer system secretin TraK [Rickettsiaceae bacterium]|jgi:hypothetical protein|nr:type-F conjugative transfer system secretin TraK [Rickettsiaceae bacterium]